MTKSLRTSSKADRDTKLFGNTPEAVEEYKQWAAKHVPVAKLPNACHPSSHTSETYDAPIAERPLLHYGTGFKADELVRFAEKHQKLSAETRPVMFGMFSAKALARYLGIRADVELAAVRPLSVDYDWVIAWYRTTGKFRELRVSKRAKYIIVKDVERILGEAREPLWWWDDCWTCSGNDRRGEWPETRDSAPTSDAVLDASDCLSSPSEDTKTHCPA